MSFPLAIPKYWPLENICYNLVSLLYQIIYLKILQTTESKLWHRATVFWTVGANYSYSRSFYYATIGKNFFSRMSYSYIPTRYAYKNFITNIYRTLF